MADPSRTRGDRSERPRAAVLGHPVSHSRSPALHAAAYRVLGLEADYDARDVTVEQLPSAVAGIRPEAGERWWGLSVTMPLKAAAVPLMDDCSERVRRLGVLNTVVVGRDGRLTGHNTDVDGIVAALRYAGMEGTGGRLGILGGGGTAAAAVAAAAALGLTGVDVFVRTPSRAEGLVPLAEGLGLTARIRDLAEFPASAGALRAVVATLPPHGADETARQLTLRASGALPPLLDAAYDPWPSALATAWQSGGGRVVSGLEMLLYQAVEQVRLFTDGRDTPHTPDWSAVTTAMAAAVGLPER